jgi:AcrR family transcriptional regulator
MSTSKRRPPTDPASGPVGDETRTRILDAAERLFAERGIEAVSVRSILAAAGVNVALAHYHFGSREGLIAELLRVRIAPVMSELVRAIEEVDARGPDATLEDVLRAYFARAATSMLERPACSRLIAQLQSGPSLEIRALGDDAIRGVMNALAAAVLKRLPAGLSAKQVFLRLLLAVSGPASLARGWERVLESARRRLGPDVSFDPAMVAEEFAAFAAAGLRAAAVGEGGDRDRDLERNRAAHRRANRAARGGGRQGPRAPPDPAGGPPGSGGVVRAPRRR